MVSFLEDYHYDIVLEALLSTSERATIWRGRMLKNGTWKEICVKQLANGPQLEKCVLNELEIYSRIGNHQNIADLYCAVKDDFGVYLCYELGVPIAP
jgi:hypothetical protein